MPDGAEERRLSVVLDHGHFSSPLHGLIGQNDVSVRRLGSSPIDHFECDAIALFEVRLGIYTVRPAAPGKLDGCRFSVCRSGTEKSSGCTDSQIRTLAGCRPWPPVWSSSACSAYRPIVIGTGEIHADGNSQTSSVSVRQRLKNSVKQCQTMKGKIPGQLPNQLVTGGSRSSSHG